MTCETCGRANPADAAFCAGCGGALARACTACDRANEADARFCNGCGRPLLEDPAATTERDPRAYTPKHLADKILRSKSALEGERKRVTVLFADVRGSMELSEAVDPEEWHRILEAFFRILTDGVHRFEGTVNQYTGDGIMALFGAPIAHEDHAQRACYAALHLKEGLARHARELKRERGVQLLTRIGLHSGEVVVGKIGDDLRMDYTAQGHTVGLAQRMESLAAPDTVYLSADTAGLVSGYFDVEDIGDFSVKGVTGAVRVFELRGLGEHRTRFDISRARGLTRFVGRDTDMRTLDDALAQAHAGNGQVLGVVADAGTGKSRLCFEFVKRCRNQGLRVLQGQCVAHGKNLPFLPILQVFRQSLGIGEGEDVRLVRERIAGRVLLLDDAFRELLPICFDFFGVPDPERPTPPMAPELRQRQLFAVLRKTVKERQDEPPTVTLIEDLHWIDGGSEAFLEELVDAVAGTRSLLLVNFRPEYHHADWMGKSYYRQLPLAPLGPEAIRELLDDLLGSDPSLGQLADTIHARTGGNPFFTEEVVWELVESGTLVGSRGAYRLSRPVEELAIPATVHATLAARIDRLAEREKRVLQAAAVIGQEFAEPILEAVAELPAPELASALAELKSAEFVYEQSLYPVAEYSFKHPLTQDVALASQLAERRQRTHAGVARALETVHADLLDERAALLAHHWTEADEPESALRWHARAARWAGRNDPMEGLRHWQRVVELGRDTSVGPELDALRVEAARNYLYSGSWRLGLDAEEMENLSQESEAIAERLGDRASQAVLLAARAAHLTTVDRVPDGLELSRRADALVTPEDDRDVWAAIKSGLLHNLAVRGELEEAAHESQRLVEEVDPPDLSLGLPVIGYSAYTHWGMVRAWTLGFLGRLEEARGEIARALTLARDSSQREMLAFCLSLDIWLADAAGHELSAEERPVDQTAFAAMEIAEELGSPYSLVIAHRDLGTAHLAAGRPGEAIAALERSVELANEHRIGLDMEPWSLARLSGAHLAAGESERAVAAAQQAAALADARGVRMFAPLARLALARAILAREARDGGDRIEEVLGEAEALVAQTGGRVISPGIVECRAELAGARDEPAERERLLRDAQALYAEGGADGHAARVAELLSA